MIQIEQGETINAVIPVENFETGQYLFFTTKKGIIKKTSLEDYGNIRKGGLIALTLREDDDLIGVKLTSGSESIIIGTKLGLSIHFPEDDVRPMGVRQWGKRHTNI